ncbi:Putative Mg2+ and Co2+ transporter CorB [Fusobacterium necrogenes]|uniref:Mg2+ and Co2+ transporter CorB n=1 Tax=Fusobacterium necrogenes TaxID=858 RepID=A0A377GVN2_9FUSO|nr:hemolysin family protein [Fusobacterium necrogenes]STO31009.1 Putative Mg2+ and Co2+ transporter CorB [Fusobacterium necrogenes]
MDTYKNILLLVILIMLSGFFSASETALTSFRSIHLEKFENDKNIKKIELLKNWLKNPNEMLTGLLVGNNIVNILASSIATVVTINVIGEASSSSVAVATIGMTIIILIFGEITPKIIAKNQAVKIAGIVINIIYYFTWILKPIIKILMMISKFIGRMLGIEIKNEGFMITEEDIISFVNVGEAEGIIEEEEKEMIHSIVGFGETTAKEVMTPRTSMFALEGEKTLDDVWDEIIENGFSRIPVYKDTIDNIIGVLYVKDVLSIIKDGKTDTPIKNFVRLGYFVPETKSIIEILQEFRSMKVHIAMVLDEYGGIVGLVTIEDLIEEITGEIRDEFDTEEEELIHKINDNTYEVDGMIDIETLDKELSIKLPESEDYESLGGLIVTELGRVAIIGDIVNIEDVRLEVLEVDKMRVSKVLIELNIGENPDDQKV